MLQPTITGKVVDENNKPISDVNVYERNGTGNTRTDINGNFSLKVASLDNDLQFSHLSYGKETISVYAFNQTKVFKFLPQYETLDDVQVGGAASNKKDNTLLWILGIGVAIYVGSKLMTKPVKTVRV